MGSPKDESFRDPDEGPQKNVKVDRFWMGQIEVSWEAYEAFYKETGVKRDIGKRALAQKTNAIVDTISGPTPPYGNPDQGWGRGKRPAISMTHFAAKVYCEWLSQKTGKTYRLPTEAEWEYACRAGSNSAYFFDGQAQDFDVDALSNRLFGVDTSINRYVVYKENSNGMTHIPQSRKANAFGLLHMLGNVKEFCADFYVADAYSAEGQKEKSAEVEYVVRGGSFKSSIGDVRSAAREKTRTKAWLITDPQIPKSRWWYSDCNDVGFRVVCDYPINQ
jgi:formylglycine-generating enzyme